MKKKISCVDWKIELTGSIESQNQNGACFSTIKKSIISDDHIEIQLFIQHI